MIVKVVTILIVHFLLFNNLAFAQEKNPIEYPYGGEPDSSRYNKLWMDKIPLNYTKAIFVFARFDSLAYFKRAQFNGPADFFDAQFDSLADFFDAQFNGPADFTSVKFDSLVNFYAAQFDSLADFGSARFIGRARFIQTQFNGPAYFSGAQFNGPADFFDAQFDSLADFTDAMFYREILLNSTKFNKQIFFRNAHIDSFVDLSLAEIKDTIFVGIDKSSDIQKYDFMRAKLLPKGRMIIPPDKKKGTPIKLTSYPGARILLYGAVDLKIQLEKH